MDTIGALRTSRIKWRLNSLLTLYILLFTQCKGDTSHDITKTDLKLDNNLDSIHCHSCYSSSTTESHVEKYVDVVDDIVGQLNTFTDQHLNLNKTVVYLEKTVEDMLDRALSNDRFKIFDGVEVKPVGGNDTKVEKKSDEGRALFSKYTYEYRIYQKVKDFVNTHILSINLPMAAKYDKVECLLEKFKLGKIYFVTFCTILIVFGIVSNVWRVRPQQILHTDSNRRTGAYKDNTFCNVPAKHFGKLWEDAEQR
ncbi:hypothetical protein HF086_011852 [Spodoptera exigua]|uniref:Uncharacterized protein n=1 Tax=Spodoptera exigua TaxID=7107 RepID=A0A922MXE0_SPOEX|nr:hypothetical protein HF086_011852 [Spodoptera exigua]